MRHKILNLLVATLVALVLAGSAAAADALRLGIATAPPGATVELALDLRGDAVAMQWDLRYPEVALALESVTLDHDGFRVDSAHVGPGHLRVVVRATACAATPATPPAVTGHLRLRVDPGAAPGRHRLAVDSVLAVGVDGRTLDAGPHEDGAVIVGGGPAPAAVPIPTLGLPALLALLVLVFVASLLALRTRALTMWLVAAVVFASAPPPVRAGSGPDADVNIVDVILGRGGDAALADCNGDGRVDVADLACVQAAACAGTTDGSTAIDGAKADERTGTAVPRGSDPPIFGDGFEGDGTPNLPPVFDPINDRSLLVGEVLRVQLRGTDPNPGDRLRYALDAAPVGVALDAQTGALQWVPATDQAGDNPITVRVSDVEGLFDTASFVVSVNRRGSPPVLADIADRTVVLGESLALTATASDPDLPDDTLSFAIVAAPTGLTLDPASGAIAWTPQAGSVGVHEVTIEVLDRIGLSDFTRFVVRVRAPNGAPVARDDGYVAPRGETTRVAAPGVIGNDEDPDGDALTATLVDGPSYGTLDFNPNGSFDYRPGAVGVPFEAEQAFRQVGAGWPSGVGTFFWAYGAAVGDLDGDGHPEVVAHGQRAGGAANSRWLGVFRTDPASGQLAPVHARHYHQDSGEDPQWIFEENSYPSLADLDGDGQLEVILPAYCDAELVVYGHDLSPLFVTSDFHVASDPTCAAGVFSDSRSNRVNVADLDGDGTPELVQLANRGHANTDVVARNADGSLRWQSPLLPLVGGERVDFAPVVVADLDLDGRAEIMAMRFVLEHDGQLRFAFPSVHAVNGLTVAKAVANLDDDAFGELLIASPSGGLEARNHDGSCLWRNYWGTGSPPIGYDCPVLRSMPLPEGLGYNVPRELYVADVDRDGHPEIVMVTRGGLYVFERDGSLVWRTDPRIGGNRVDFVVAAVFDFDGDGYMEIVLTGASEASNLNTGIQIRDGRDGSVLQELPGGSVHPGTGATSGSWPNAVLVADLDGDRHAEFLVVAGGFSQLGNAGLLAYRSANVPWMPARPLWNQYDYQITNIEPDGSMPARPRVNWLEPGLNNYRVNVPTLEEPGGFDQFTYRVSDGTLESDPATVALEIRRGNRAPVILSQPPLVVGAGFAYRYPVLGFDADPGDSVTLALARGPAGMTLGADRTVRWSPISANLGEHPVVVSARDTEGAIAVQSYILRVVEAQPVPDVVGQSQAAAVVAIEAAGFTRGRIEARDHPTVPVGAVAVQTPPGGANEPPGSAVALVVSTGPGPADRDADGDTYTPNGGDCNDADPAINPAAADPFGDGIDQDCDGVDGSEPVTSIRVTPGTLTLLAGERAQLAAWAGFADGSAQPVTGAVAWSSSGGAASVDSQGRLVANSAGSATITATRQGRSGTASIAIRARVAGDIAAPVAEIATPVDGAAVIEPIDILGTASDPNLVRYELALAPADGGDFVLIGVGTTSVVDASLGQLDPTTLLNGLYRLRLRVLDAGGNLSEDEALVQVDGLQKVGHLAFTITDLRVPMAGLPIVVERAYDSRDRRRGDFGIGWQLGLTSISLHCTRPLGEGWQVVRGGLAFVLQATRPHRCTVDIPGRPLERFDFVPTPASSPLVPFSFLTGQFRPQQGTFGTLDVVGGANLAIIDAQPGEVALLDDTTLQTFAPRRLRYTTRDGNRMEFLDGRLVRVDDRNGNTVVFGPDGIQHSAGKGIAFTRDAAGRIVRIVGPSGAEQRYAYSAAGNLVAHTDALGNVTRYYYDASQRLVRIVDPLGRPQARTTYDADGRVIAITDADGATTTVAHDLGARTETRTLPDGSTTFRRWDARGNVQEEIDAAGVRTTYAWNALDLVATITNGRGASQHFDYDSRGRLTRVEHPSGATYTTVPNAFGSVDEVVSPLGEITRYRYDARGNLIESIDPAGEVRRFAYDARGHLTARQRPDGTVERYEIDAEGNLRALTDALGRRTEYAYDSEGRPTSVSALVTTSQGPQTLTRTEVFDAAGRQIASIDPAGHTVQIELDFAGRPLATIDPLGSRVEQDWDATGDLAETRFPDGTTHRLEQDAAGRIVSQVGRDGREVSMEYAQGSVLSAVAWADYTPGDPTDDPRLSFTTNDLGQLASIASPEGTLLALEQDAQGRLASRTENGRRIRYEYDLLGRKSAEIDDAGRRTTFEYDAPGRHVRTVHPDGSELRFEYDAMDRMVRRIDESGRAQDFEYDAVGNLVAVRDGLGHVTRYGWNELGQRISQTDANGRTTAFEYDRAGRRTAIIRPDGATTRFEYDAAGNLLRRIDPDGRELIHIWDAGNRLVRRIHDGRAFDATWDGEGRALSAEDVRGAVTYSYDEAGRLVERLEPDGGFVRWRHDRAGRVVEITTPSGTVRFQRAADGRLSRVIDRDGETWDYEYDALGRVTRIVNAHLTEERSWDLRDRPTRISFRDAGGVERLRYDYAYDAAGRVLSVTALDGSQVGFQYDAAGRLVGETRSGAFSGTTTWVLDAVGNTLSRTGPGGSSSFEYDANDRLVETIGPEGTTRFEWDASGRLLAESGARNVGYAWSGTDRLIGLAAAGSPVVAFDYDWDGNLVSRRSGAETTRFLTDTSGEYARIIEEYADGGGARVPIVFGDGPLAQGLGAAKRRHALDAHSGVRALFDTSGPVSSLAWDAYGTPLAPLGESRLGYRGERQGGPLDQIYLRARHYDPRRGRFLSVDPHGGLPETPLTLHSYLYGNADPVNHIDPSGEIAFLPVAALAGLSTGALAVLNAAIGSAVLSHIAIDSHGLRRRRADDVLWSTKMIAFSLDAGLALGGTALVDVKSPCVPGKGQVRGAGYLSVLLGLELGAKVGVVGQEAEFYTPRLPGPVGFRQGDFEGWTVSYIGANVVLGGGASAGSYYRANRAVSLTPLGFNVQGPQVSASASAGGVMVGWTFGMGNDDTFHVGRCPE